MSSPCSPSFPLSITGLLTPPLKFGKISRQTATSSSIVRRCQASGGLSLNYYLCHISSHVITALLGCETLSQQKVLAVRAKASNLGSTYTKITGLIHRRDWARGPLGVPGHLSESVLVPSIYPIFMCTSSAVRPIPASFGIQIPPEMLRNHLRGFGAPEDRCS